MLDLLPTQNLARFYIEVPVLVAVDGLQSDRRQVPQGQVRIPQFNVYHLEGVAVAMEVLETITWVPYLQHPFIDNLCQGCVQDLLNLKHRYEVKGAVYLIAIDVSHDNLEANANFAL